MAEADGSSRAGVQGPHGRDLGTGSARPGRSRAQGSGRNSRSQPRVSLSPPRSRRGSHVPSVPDPKAPLETSLGTRGRPRRLPGSPLRSRTPSRRCSRAGPGAFRGGGQVRPPRSSLAASSPLGARPLSVPGLGPRLTELGDEQGHRIVLLTPVQRGGRGAPVAFAVPSRSHRADAQHTRLGRSRAGSGNARSPAPSSRTRRTGAGLEPSRDPPRGRPRPPRLRTAPFLHGPAHRVQGRRPRPIQMAPGE